MPATQQESDDGQAEREDRASGTPGDADGSGGADGAVSVGGRLEPPVCASTLPVGGVLERHEDEPAVAILVWSADQLPRYQPHSSSEPV